MNNLITTNTINNVNICLNHGELYFTIGETFSVVYENMIEHDFEIKEENNCFSIKDKRKTSFRLFGKKSEYTPIIRITLPKQYIFERISLSTGACEILADTLTANVFTLKTGAGEVHIKNLNVSNHASIESGAGEIHIASGHIHNLEISAGAGEVHIKSALTGNSNITTGVGEIQMQLLGNPDDYSATISKALGSLHVSGFNSGNGVTYGSGPNHIKVTSGVGEIHLGFAEI